MGALKDKTKFNVGDKVVCVKDYQSGGWLGLVGTVVRVVGEDYRHYRVDFHRQSHNYKGHNLKGEIMTNTGWSFDANDKYLALVSRKQTQLELDF
jgi:hypothetical protein